MRDERKREARTPCYLPVIGMFQTSEPPERGVTTLTPHLPLRGNKSRSREMHTGFPARIPLDKHPNGPTGQTMSMTSRSNNATFIAECC